jgi:putative transposase
MEDEKIYYCRNLPHYQSSHAAYFITFRLAGSLPNEVIIKLKEEYEVVVKHLETIIDPVAKKKELDNHRKKYFEKFDEFLDKHAIGPTWLSSDCVAQIVFDAICYRNGKEYELIAYCIMPNHVHMIINVERSDTSFYKVLQSLKAHTARECNKILNRSGAFWQHESYDHVIRNSKELESIIWYVLNNPVKAGLVDDWQKWKWSYCQFE